MEKIWIITIDDVSDFENFPCSPVAYRSEKDAREALQVYKDGIKDDYADDLNEGYVAYNEGENWAEVSGDSYAREHYSVTLHCVELK